jgi:SAM-dependent methyltransferase
VAALALPTSEGSFGARSETALLAYESIAPFYDRFTADYEYASWLNGIEAWALAEGLAGRRLLDVGCGTGKSFEPMLAKGYQVTACDLSPAMVAQARARAGNAAEILVADMRGLPWDSQFDLVTCLDDAINYMLTPADLLSALMSMTAALRPGGVLVFDFNTLATYRTTFAEEFEIQSEAIVLRWHGEGSRDAKAGEVSQASVTAFGPDGRMESRHVQRHWPVDAVRFASEAAGLGHIGFRGQVTGGQLVGPPDEDLHPKAMCLAVRATD